MDKTKYWENKSLDSISDTIDGVLYVESWGDVAGYNGLYKVSSFGRVMSVGRRFEYSNLGWITTEDRIMKQRLTKMNYLEIGLCKNGKTSYYTVHRLVAKCFCENPHNKDTVNHKNGVRDDNFFINLEWNTYSENLKHSFRELGRVPIFNTYKDEKHPMAKKINCCTLDICFKTLKEACEKLNVNRNAVYKVCIGAAKHTKGLTFRYI